ncbi:MAG: PAS domain-containing protein [Atopostipes sp.]|nr:PAS domain-containing protein [Atopostipes sp.]
MKLVGLVGSNAEYSYNRKLLKFIAEEYTDLFDLELLEIDDVPLFNESNDQTESEVIQKLNQKILAADGIIIATPEHNRTIPPALKSVIEWLSYKIHPMDDKPVLVVGASYYDQGTSRAQLHLRQILEAPGVGAYTFPGNEFLLGKVKEAFDDNGKIKDQETVSFLRSILVKYVRFVNLINDFDEVEEEVLPEEDLYATGSVDTSIEGVDKDADDWVEQAAEKVDAVEGDTYVKLDRGILTVDQLNYFLNSMPMELTYADSNNQFLYYNHHIDGDDMLANRYPRQVGSPLASCHPKRTFNNVEWVIQQLRAGKMDTFSINVPTHGPDKYVVHNYTALKDKNGNYAGINEYVLDIQPIIDWYLKQTNQELVDGPEGAGGGVDAMSGATENIDDEEETDSVSSASVND